MRVFKQVAPGEYEVIDDCDSVQLDRILYSTTRKILVIVPTMWDTVHAAIASSIKLCEKRFRTWFLDAQLAGQLGIAA
jgi:hypothetical protein